MKRVMFPIYDKSFFATEMTAMSRNTLPPVIAILAAGAAILGYMYYQDQQTSGVEIKIGDGGISIEEN